MAKYRITLKKSVAKYLRVIPKSNIQKILSKIDSLFDNPCGEGCIKLSGKKTIEFVKDYIE